MKKLLLQPELLDQNAVPGKTANAGRSNQKITRLFIVLAILVSAFSKAQMMIPYTGSNTLTCGTNTSLVDHAGNSFYANNADGFTVLNCGFNAVININGSYDTEWTYDYIFIYAGAGTGGALLGQYDGQSTLNYTGQPGQILTIRFYSDGYYTRPGFSLNITYSGMCAPLCSGAPGSNTVLGSQFPICPNSTAFLSLVNSYTASGLTYSWQSSNTSSVGPWAAVPGGTSAALSSPPLTANTWFQVAVTCTVGNQTTTSGAGLINVQGTTINNVPYFEGFEGIPYNNTLPNCSWTASNASITALTYTSSNPNSRIARTGNKFASFFYSPAGTKNFYSNGIQMYAGVTYSASVWYITEQQGYNNWTDFSMMVGPNQSAVGQQTIAQTGPAIAPFYRSLTNTFTVPNNGIYYINLRGTSTTNSSAQYLSWDDLWIQIPCQLGTNTPPLMVTATPSNVCSGQAANLMASGADTYSWSTGATGNQISVTPFANATYVAIGTNTASGCTSNVTQQVKVNPSPLVGVVAVPPVVCAGQPLSLIASGADTYTWSAGGQGAVLVATPSGNITYSVTGKNQFGCTGSSAISITVHALPTVQGQASPTMICVGESAVLLATGAQNYQWLANTAFIQSNPANVKPLASTSYTLVGTDANGCSNSTIVNLGVNDCTGINVNASAGTLKVFPNPTKGEIKVVTSNGLENKIEIIDLRGRILVSQVTTSAISDLNLGTFAAGIYYIKVSSSASVDVMKIVKE